MKGIRAFTLIELLVVIAVIAVLMGILMPSLSMARNQAKKVVSTSNMRQIGMAMELYADDNRGFFPETSHGLTKTETRKRSWIFTLSKYLGDVNEVRICPADPQRKERRLHPTSSYTLNEYIALEPRDPFGRLVGKSYRNKNRLKRSCCAITTFILADHKPASETSDHTHSRLWFQGASADAWGLIRDDIQVDRFGGRKDDDNTNGSSLYLYADSHVENLRAQVIKDWADEGFNFAKPPGR